MSVREMVEARMDADVWRYLSLQHVLRRSQIPSQLEPLELALTLSYFDVPPFTFVSAPI